MVSQATDLLRASLDLGLGCFSALFVYRKLISFSEKCNIRRFYLLTGREVTQVGRLYAKRSGIFRTAAAVSCRTREGQVGREISPPTPDQRRRAESAARAKFCWQPAWRGAGG